MREHSTAILCQLRRVSQPLALNRYVRLTSQEPHVESIKVLIRRRLFSTLVSESIRDEFNDKLMKKCSGPFGTALSVSYEAQRELEWFWVVKSRPIG